MNSLIDRGPLTAEALFCTFGWLHCFQYNSFISHYTNRLLWPQLSVTVLQLAWAELFFASVSINSCLLIRIRAIWWVQHQTALEKLTLEVESNSRKPVLTQTLHFPIPSHWVVCQDDSGTVEGMDYNFLNRECISTTSEQLMQELEHELLS